MDDKLKEMFVLQERFMKCLQDKHGKEKFPDWPLDISEKSSQKLCKGFLQDSILELTEAIQHFKNSKTHRVSLDTDFDREAYLIECVDSFKFMIESFIYMGISFEEFFEAYKKKDQIIHERLKQGY